MKTIKLGGALVQYWIPVVRMNKGEEGRIGSVR